MNIDEKQALATLIKLTIVNEIAKNPRQRDPEYKAIIARYGLDGVDHLIDQLMNQ